MKTYYVYILSNNSKTLYIGVTNNLERRMYEHRNKLIDGFSKKYNLTKLVYFEMFNDINDAIKKEKQLKNWHRPWKINLIESINREWKDLSTEYDDETRTKPETNEDAETNADAETNEDAETNTDPETSSG
ncbi:MAG: GIY-YIG nuclease family protein [Ignavibacteriales bacterium]|nr:MAG: GIY-YIG nuclease family protein [Ignavibacteriales bacterium]